MIIFTFGVSDTGLASISPDKNGQPNIHVDGSCNALGNIDLGSQKAFPLMLYGANAKQPPFNTPEKPSLIFNQISNADTHRIALARCKKICTHFEGTPVINHPDAVLESTRDAVYRKLNDIDGLTIPKTVRCVPESPEHVFKLIESEGLELPVILRTAGEHNSMNMILIHGVQDLEKLLTIAFDGSDHYLIEFIDSADEHGIYTKYRILMVDGKPCCRHILFGPDWLVNSDSYEYMKAHHEMDELPEMMEKFETDLMPKANAALVEVGKRMKLDLFGIDCHVDDEGHLLIFEANANMFALSDTMKSLSSRVQLIRGKIRQMMDQRSISAPTENFSYSRTIQH